MKILRAAGFGAVYFAIVFAAGVVLGSLRVLALEPALGPRAAELAELPVMAALSLLAARRLTRIRPELSALPAALICGATALCLLLLAEIGVVLVVLREDLGGYAARRDPVSGLAYLAAIAVFALAPALLRPRRGA